MPIIDLVQSTHLATHYGDGLAMRARTARGPSGADVTPIAVEQVTGGGHHRQAVVVFPGAAGATEVAIAVKNVGGVSERVSRWRLPLAR